MRDSLLVFFPILLLLFFFGKFNNLDFIFYLGWSILNYAEIAFRYDTEMQCQKNYLSLEQPAQEAESFSMVENSLRIPEKLQIVSSFE